MCRENQDHSPNPTAEVRASNEHSAIRPIELEFVAVVGVGDGDQAAGSLVEAGSARRGHAVSGGDVIDGAPSGPLPHRWTGSR
jgi:hypothetical protein